MCVRRVVEELLVGCSAAVGDGVPAEEAVLGREVALDVDEADHPLGVCCSEVERGESSHRVTDEMESFESEAVDHGQAGAGQ